MEEWVLPGLAAVMGVVFILFILVIVLFGKLAKLRKSYTSLMNGEKNINLEELVVGIQSKITSNSMIANRLEDEVKKIQESMKSMKTRINLYRYSAFADMGSTDLSFSLAILDELGDGIILTSIYGRDQTYIYAKPIQNGGSTYTLSPEEKEAIKLTLK